MATAETGALIFGLLSAVAFGVGDFSGGFATRRISVISVIAIAHGAGLALLIVLALLTREALPPLVDIMWGLASGTAGMIGLSSLYRGLAIGRAGIVTPITGVLGAALPVLFALLTRGLPSTVQIIGFVVGFIGVWLVSGSGGAGEMSGVGLALMAGVGFGVFYIFLDQISPTAFFWPLVASRTASFVLMVLTLLVSRVKWIPHSRTALLIVVIAGILDVGGNAFFLLAVRTGRLDIAAIVSSSFYPAVTIILAWFILKENLARMQIIGILAALISIGLIATG